MGDVGSITVGFMAGTLILLGLRDKVFEFWVPILIFSPFILDATVTLIRRMVRGQRIWEAHREHFYQRLVLSGWGHQRTVSAEYAVMTVCGLLAIAYQYASEPWKLALLILWATLFLGLAYGVRHLEQNRQIDMNLREP
jgi:UDP-N-acetylmuramyl pentapeptide phosphotransferase/UDP-N-acetylglucosamine-1-phosphate transferase